MPMKQAPDQVDYCAGKSHVEVAPTSPGRQRGLGHEVMKRLANPESELIMLHACVLLSIYAFCWTLLQSVDQPHPGPQNFHPSTAFEPISESILA